MKKNGATLDFENVRVDLPRRGLLFSDVTFSLAAGDGLWVDGPNGAGKSTLLALSAALFSATSGAIRFSGAEVSSWSDAQRAKVLRTHIRYVPQQPVFLDRLTVLDQLAIVFSETEAELMRRVETLELVPNATAGSLSGGERMRLALAIALDRETAGLVVLDEPTAPLSDRWCVWLAQRLTALHEAGVTRIVTSHDPRLVASSAGVFSQRAHVEAGKVVVRAMESA